MMLRIMIINEELLDNKQNRLLQTIADSVGQPTKAVMDLLSHKVYFFVQFLMIVQQFKCDNMKGSKNKKYSYKYDKITLQKKFHLLNLVLREKMLIKEAAKIVGINYSTAKTILFFNRNGDKSYQFEIQKPPETLHHEEHPFQLRTSFIDLSVKYQQGTALPPLTNKIDIISTIGSKTQSLQRIKEEKNPHSLSISYQHCPGQLGTGADNYGAIDNEGSAFKVPLSIGQARPMTRSQSARFANNEKCKVEASPDEVEPLQSSPEESDY